ncbi:MAG TPA: peroxiredoxin [Actinopolymorphaceae bacterium]
MVVAIGVGEKAPEFVLPDQHGTEVGLTELTADKNVVVVFYPFAFTGVCSGELRALRDNQPRFEAAGAVVVAISCDTRFALRVFAEQEGFDFPLLADFWPHGAVARSYGVFDEERGCALRGTFVIDKSGLVKWTVVNPIPEARDVEALLEVVEALPR